MLLVRTMPSRHPLDAAAVKANYVREIGLGLGTQFIIGSFLNDASQDIVAKDAQTVVFNLSAPTPHFDLVMAAQYGTGLVSPKVFADHSTGATDQGHEWLQSHAVGTGPPLPRTFPRRAPLPCQG